MDLKAFSAAMLPVSLLLLGASNCTAPIPKWDGDIYAGKSKQDAIVRAQANEVIKCADPAFDAYLCMSYADFQSFYATYVLGCEKWKPGQMMSPEAMWARVRGEKP